MKKSLLSLAAVVVALGASAQAEEVFIDAESIDIDAANAGGYVVAQSDNVVVSLPYSLSTYKTTALAGSDDPYNTIAINGVEYRAVAGLTATGDGVNPVNPSLDDAASGGCVFQFDVKKDGYLVVFGKLSSNKNYYVWEGLSGQGATPVAYTLGMNYDDDKIVFSMPADADGYIDETAADIDLYCNLTGRKTQTPGYIYANGGDAASKNGLGVLVFQVWEEAENYLVCAQGSKISCDGGVFVTEEPTQIALVGNDGVKDLIGTYNSGVSNISVDKVYDENAPVYNVMGQRVAKDTKGILIQNGRKFINK
jgi:hypothetical protein